MKENKDGWPETFNLISLPERFCRLGNFIMSHLKHDGYRGGAAMLDRQLYDAIHETHDGIDSLVQMSRLETDGTEAW